MHDKDNELELERELHKLPIIYQWEAIRCDRASYALRWMIAIGSSLFVYGGFYLLIKDSETIIPLLLMGIAMALVSRYLFLADEHICFYLTKKGIHFTTEQIIPEMAYKVMRGGAWFGVAVSFLAVTIIGPMAFIGAGACALLSFKMTGFKSVPRSSFVYFVDEYTVFDIQKENTFSIISHPHDIYDSCYRLYYFLDDRDEIKNQLLQVIKKSHYKIINHPDDIYDYAPFEPSENLNINNANS
ncbi:hypothetical protein [Aliivibrio fischeri]|uniref:hypothetical protein n=1 Tax=Aliivibrio fischeri TaxID=668 RepID=UPI0012D92522|nr:hypothetical protein [Aliivibrio fischeri]MUK69793.1 hypothetical protein [Aliivibrio fischeri]MUK72327.1 hypothetical protein [Aliivibrio fischeri]MUK78652.1 hypothetical protein [Aliivibrio fischeri]